MLRKQQLPLLALVTMACLSTSCVTTGKKSVAKDKPLPYPFDYCAVIRKPFDKGEGPKYVRIHDGFEVGFCCTPCIKSFEVHPEAFMTPIREFYADPNNLAAATGKKKRKKFGSN